MSWRSRCGAAAWLEASSSCLICEYLFFRDPPDLTDPLARTVELVVMEPSVPLVLVDPLDTSDLV